MPNFTLFSSFERSLSFLTTRGLVGMRKGKGKEKGKGLGEGKGKGVGRNEERERGRGRWFMGMRKGEG